MILLCYLYYCFFHRTLLFVDKTRARTKNQEPRTIFFLKKRISAYDIESGAYGLDERCFAGDITLRAVPSFFFLVFIFQTETTQ